MLRLLKDQDLMGRIMPGSGSFNPENSSIVLVGSSKGIEETNNIEGISDSSYILDGRYRCLAEE